MGKLTLILGGARSGKSTYAQNMAMECEGKVTYIATAEALDDEMAARIENHKKERPQDWETREIPRELAATLQKNPVEADIVLLDCLTLLVSNLLLNHASDEEPLDEKSIHAKGLAEIEALLGIIQKSPADWIIVSNEVGLGLVPPTLLGRVYRDLLGSLNQKLAARADEVFFLVAGIAIPVHKFRG
jgi:adenosylcobinamide kinase/adenosylcobinamide-phosphate guanylyltransferase